MTEKKRDNLDRRQFIGAIGVVGAAGAIGALAAGCSGGKEGEAVDKKRVQVEEPQFLDQAPDGEVLKAGLIGCGGRGTGAALNFLSSGPNLEIVALGDVFEDRLNGCRERLKKEKNVEIADGQCFVGFDAYKKVIDAGVDVILTATPPHFRPEHFAACIEARKHVFMEKPVAVDPVGARSIIATSRKADAVGLCVVTGTQRHHQRDYVSTYARIASGAIGQIVSANCYWNQSQLWYRNRQEGWSDMEYMIRDWVNWCWLSGDHIVEQHVHNIDVINWFSGAQPEKAVGFGGRHRRKTGDQYDFFSVDFEYDNGMHVHSMCRQIDGCADNVSERIQGTKGWSNCKNTIYNPDGSVQWKYDYGLNAEGKPRNSVAVSPYVQEHIDLVAAIRAGKPINEAERTAISTLAAVMGRISAYTGKKMTWDEMMSSSLRIGPETYALGPVAIEPVAPVPGT